jgi:transposase
MIKGTRWLLLKNNDNLNESKNEFDRLEAALSVNKPLATAYYLKEELRWLWLQDSIISCEKFLGQWVAKAIASGIKELQKFAKTLLKHRFGIFNWYKFKISSGPLEGLNNKIKVMKRKAYGFRDIEFFKLKIYDIHNAKHQLIG